MRRYKRHLEFCAESEPAKREELDKQHCRGWFIGDKEEKKALKEELDRQHPDVDWEGVDLKELNQAKWESLTKRLLEEAGKNESDTGGTPNGADWKAAIARTLRTSAAASNPWIASRLNMGHPSRISNLIRENQNAYNQSQIWRGKSMP